MMKETNEVGNCALRVVHIAKPAGSASILLVDAVIDCKVTLVTLRINMAGLYRTQNPAPRLHRMRAGRVGTVRHIGKELFKVKAQVLPVDVREIKLSYAGSVDNVSASGKKEHNRVTCGVKTFSCFPVSFTGF
jgi:hypothetical protein